jgi:uncharacterized membrane protein
VKKLLNAVLMITSLSTVSSAFANDLCTDTSVECVLRCMQSEPFIYSVYDFRSEEFTMEGDGTTDTLEKVTWTYVGYNDGIPFFTLTNSKGDLILELYEDGRGEDGMSEKTYQYSAYDVAGRAVGCDLVEK